MRPLDALAREQQRPRAEDRSLPIQDGSRYAVYLYVSRAAILVRGLVLGRLLGPSGYGIAAALATYLAYSSYLDLGLFHALNRQVPLLRGAGRVAEVREVESLAYGGSIVLAVLGALAIFGVAVLQALSAVKGSWLFTTSLGVVVLLQQLAGYWNARTYAEKRFSLQGRALFVAAVIDLTVAVVAAVAGGAYAVVATAGVAIAVQYVILVHGFRDRVRPVFALRPILALVWVGLPIELMWLANTNMVGMDKLVALFGLGVRALGMYSLAATAGALVMIAPNAVASVLAPRILERFGRDRSGDQAFVLMAWGQDVASLVGALFAAVGAVLIPAATRLVLPRFLPAVPAAQVLMFASAVLAAATPVGSYLVGHDRQLRVAATYGLNAVFNLLVDVALLRAGYGITGVAVGSLVSYSLLLLCMSSWSVREGGRRGSARQRLAATSAPLIAGALLAATATAVLARTGAALSVPASSGCALAVGVLLLAMFRDHARTVLSTVVDNG